MPYIEEDLVYLAGDFIKLYFVNIFGQTIFNVPPRNAALREQMCVFVRVHIHLFLYMFPFRCLFFVHKSA